MSITAKELYNKLIEIKKNSSDPRLNSVDLLQFGDVRRQMDQLEYEGKIIRYNDIIDSFDVIE